MTTSILQGAQAKCLALETITGLSEELGLWRSKYEIQLMQKKKAKGRVFDFVKGLRLSARLIYIIREHLSRYPLEVDWGQVIDDSGAHLSPECDVIIHRPGNFKTWNGRGAKEQVMNFKFIPRSDVSAVISCKSLLAAIKKKHTEYCEGLRPYLRGKKLWLFAECVPKGKGKKIAADALNAGYNKCWWLYSWDRDSSMTQRDEALLLNFIEEIFNLGERASGGT